MTKIRVTILINGLIKAGAETMLYQLLKFRTDDNIEYKVLSLGLSHYYEDSIKKMGIEVVELSIKKQPLSTVYRLSKELKKTDVLCCWMYLSNLIGYILGRRGTDKLIWCIRHSDLSKENNSIITRITNRLCIPLSKKVDVVAYNGMRAKQAHERMGYRAIRSIVLENGLDIDEYRYSESSRERLRKKIGIDEGTKVILSIARYHQIKDIPTFIKMMAIIKKQMPKVIAVMCGKGIDANNEELTGLIADNGLNLDKDIYALGFRENIPEIMSASDIYVLHSAGEAFPNTLIQAMACETLVISTDVGDVREILGDYAYIARPGDVDGLSGLAINLMSLNEDEKMRIRKTNRQIIESKYDIRQVVKTYEEIFVS